LPLVQTAKADAGRFELIWSAPKACPTKERVQQRVERILNRPVSVPDDELLIVTAVVKERHNDGPWRVELETNNGQRRASRSLEAASCNELANATALFVAILIEPSVDEPVETNPSSTQASSAAELRTSESRADTRNAAPRTAAIPSTKPAATADHGSDSDPESQTQTGSEPRWAVGGFGGVVSGTLPVWSPGFGVQGAFTWKALRTNLGATFWWPVTTTIETESAQGAEFQLFSGHTEVCLQHTIRQLSPAICAGAQLANLRGKGFGAGVDPQVQYANFVSLSAGGALIWSYSKRLSVLLDFDAVFPLGDRQFVFTGSDPALLHRPAMGARITCGAEFIL
jgi:hypothetical protein